MNMPRGKHDFNGKASHRSTFSTNWRIPPPATGIPLLHIFRWLSYTVVSHAFLSNFSNGMAMIFTPSRVSYHSWLMPHPLKHLHFDRARTRIRCLDGAEFLPRNAHKRKSFCSQGRCSTVLSIIKTELCRGRKNGDISQWESRLMR